MAVSPCCSSVATCCLPAHISLCCVGRSSLPFASVQTLTPSRQLPPNPVAVSLCCSSVAASLPFVKTFKILGSSFHQALWPQAFVVVGTLTPAVCFHRVCCSRVRSFRLPAFTTSQMLRGRGFAIAICSYGKRSVFLFHFLFSLPFLWGTCPCFIWHRFPDGVTCATAMRPHDCDDQTTVEHTGQLCA